jgi:hypothetical protein
MNPHSSARDPPRPHSRTASVKASVGGLCLLAFVCTAANGSARITTADGPGRATAVAGGYGLFPSPARLATQCRRAQRHVRFTVLCPTVLPRSGDGVTAATASPLPPGDAGVEPTTFAQWAGYPANVTARSLYVGGIYGSGETDPADWSLNNPNYFFHFFVDEGKLAARELNLTGVSHPQRLLGARTIAGHRGKLYDQVSYSICSECSFTGHLTFVWQQDGIVYAASLHRWSPTPNSSVAAVLAALIKGLRQVH